MKLEFGVTGNLVVEKRLLHQMMARPDRDRIKWMT
jgi:hypothetical protein